eukprot:223852-Pelagomonas_calceolata.AAC.1
MSLAFMLACPDLLSGGARAINYIPSPIKLQRKPWISSLHLARPALKSAGRFTMGLSLQPARSAVQPSSVSQIDPSKKNCCLACWSMPVNQKCPGPHAPNDNVLQNA